MSSRASFQSPLTESLAKLEMNTVQAPKVLKASRTTITPRVSQVPSCAPEPAYMPVRSPILTKALLTHPPLRYTPNVKYYPNDATPEQCNSIDEEYHIRRTMESGGYLSPPPLRYTPNVKYYPNGATPEQCKAIDEEYHRRRTAEALAVAGGDPE